MFLISCNFYLVRMIILYIENDIFSIKIKFGRIGEWKLKNNEFGRIDFCWFWFFIFIFIYCI